MIGGSALHLHGSTIRREPYCAPTWYTTSLKRTWALIHKCLVRVRVDTCDISCLPWKHHSARSSSHTSLVYQLPAAHVGPVN